MSVFSLQNTEFAALPDRDYHEFLLSSIEQAHRLVWASLFLYDVRPNTDISGLVLELTEALMHRRRAGVDVRLLLSSHTRTADIVEANLATYLFLREFSLPAKMLGANDGRYGSHAKFVIIDDVAVVGSQNWTDDGFRMNIESTVVTTGHGVTVLGNEFLRLWRLGRLPNYGTE